MFACLKMDLADFGNYNMSFCFLNNEQSAKLNTRRLCEPCSSELEKSRIKDICVN